MIYGSRHSVGVNVTVNVVHTPTSEGHTKSQTAMQGNLERMSRGFPLWGREHMLINNPVFLIYDPIRRQ